MLLNYNIIIYYSLITLIIYKIISIPSDVTVVSSSFEVQKCNRRLLKAFDTIHKQRFCDKRPCYTTKFGQELMKFLLLHPESWDYIRMDHHAHFTIFFNFLTEI